MSVFHKNSEINLIIQSQDENINREIILNIIDNANNFIKNDINKHILYSNHKLELFNKKHLQNTELIEGQPLEDYKKTSSIPKTYEPKPRGIDVATGVANASNDYYKYPSRK